MIRNVVILVMTCILSQVKSASQKRNIIFIMADDMGWNDVGFHGMTQIPTPNIDSLAAHGVLLSNYYGAPMCSPSRAALLTGRYPSRIGFQHYVIPESGPWGLPLDVPTLADNLKELGYVNRILGKWHLGFYKSEYLPVHRGFQSHFGFWTGSLDFFEHICSSSAKRDEYNDVPANVTDEKITLIGHSLVQESTQRKDLDGSYLTDLLTDKAVDIIATHNKSKPLFLVLAHHAPHRGSDQRPMRAPDKYTKPFNYIKDEKRKMFAGALTGLDQSVGKVVSALDSAAMLDNSLVIFASDNGADSISFSSNSGSNWPLRGQKITGWEGGVRLPAALWTPGLSDPGRIWDGLMHVTDWLPTLYSFAGSDPQKLTGLDGHNLWNAISGNLNSTRNEILLISDPIWKMSALRVGDYKLVRGSYPEMDLDGWYGPDGRGNVVNLVEKNESVVSRILEKYTVSKEKSWQTPIVDVNCGPKPTDPKLKCDAKNEICVFNIKEDPCELRNLARNDKKLVERLLARLEEHEAMDVPPLSTKRDYIANPELHQGLWVPWRDAKTP